MTQLKGLKQLSFCTLAPLGATGLLFVKNPNELFQRLCFEFDSRHETFHKTDDSQRNVKIKSFISWTPSEIRLDASVMAGKSKGKGKGVGKGKSNFIRQRASQIVTESGILSFSQKSPC